MSRVIHRFHYTKLITIMISKSHYFTPKLSNLCGKHLLYYEIIEFLFIWGSRLSTRDGFCSSAYLLLTAQWVPKLLHLHCLRFLINCVLICVDRHSKPRSGDSSPAWFPAKELAESHFLIARQSVQPCFPAYRESTLFCPAYKSRLRLPSCISLVTVSCSLNHVWTWKGR